MELSHFQRALTGLLFQFFLLWPRDPREHAVRLWSHLKTETGGPCLSGDIDKLFSAFSLP